MFVYRIQAEGTLDQVVQARVEGKADVQDARKIHQHHWMPSAITMVMCAMFGAIVGALFIWAIPGENKDIVVYMAGQVSGILTSCVTYWVGSTRASANKDMMRK